MGDGGTKGYTHNPKPIHPNSQLRISFLESTTTHIAEIIASSTFSIQINGPLQDQILHPEPQLNSERIAENQC